MGDREHGGGAVRTLRGRWRRASSTSGWRFPSDWAVPEVDDVCACALVRGDLIAALTALGAARARTGAGLDETLYDVAALHAVLDSSTDATQPAMLRAAALGWADATTEPETGPRWAVVDRPAAGGSAPGSAVGW
ncbi:hypothetical protein ACWEVP_14130 [Amycolatopsis sp. NPDC003865]